MSDDLAFDEEALAMEQIVRNQLAIRELEEQNEMLKQYFKDRPEKYAPGATVTRGKVTLTVAEYSRIDQKLAEKHLDKSTLDAISKSVVDSALARRRLSNEVLDKITKKYDNRLTFRVTE